MVYKELIYNIKAAFCAHPLVESFHMDIFGDAGNNISYPAVILINTGNNITEGSIVHRFNVLYVDRMMSDLTNDIEIQSVGIHVINEVYNKLFGDGVNRWKEDLSINVFREQWADICAGVVCTNFTITTTNNDCYCD